MLNPHGDDENSSRKTRHTESRRQRDATFALKGKISDAGKHFDTLFAHIMLFILQSRLHVGSLLQREDHCIFYTTVTLDHCERAGQTLQDVFSRAVDFVLWSENLFYIEIIST